MSPVRYQDKPGSLDDGGLDPGSCGGFIDEPDLSIRFGGTTPVQGDGMVDGRPCYYRSRGTGWQFSVAPPGSDDALDLRAWEWGENPYIWPDGGYVTREISEQCIRKAVALWREAGRP